MMAVDGFNRGSHCKYLIKVHLMFPVYRRKRVLEGEFEDDVIMVLKEAAMKIGVAIDSINGDRDHVHMLVSIKQVQSIYEVVHQLKQQSAYRLWLFRGRELQDRGFGFNGFWGKGYFAESIGRMDEGAIKSYINNQGK